MGTHPIFESDFDCLTDFKSVRNMASYKEGKEDLQTEQEQVHKIRITITSKNCAAIERISNELVKAAKDKQLKVKGPVRMPTKTLRITTRKTPNGEGSKTWDRFQMRIHKRVIDLQSPTETVRQITQLSIDPGMDVEVTICDYTSYLQDVQQGPTVVYYT